MVSFEWCSFCSRDLFLFVCVCVVFIRKKVLNLYVCVHQMCFFLSFLVCRNDISIVIGFF